MRALACVLVAAAAASASSTCGSSSGGPTDNPIVTAYGVQYPWAANMVNFSCVFNINDFKGSSDDDRFDAAAKAAASSTQGGVVFFPKGRYTFKGNLNLPSNVVIRGEPTKGSAKSGTKPGNLKPETVFECPARQHNGVFNNDPDAKNLGIIGVELSGCAVMLWPALDTVSKWDLKTYWYEATAVKGMGSAKVVMSNKIHDVTYEYADPSKPGGEAWPWRFSTAVAAYGSDVLVANNLISKAETSYKTSPTFSGKEFKDIEYPVDNRYGIDVNQILLGGVIGKTFASGKCKQTKAGDGLEPKCAPWFFQPGCAVRDNYVFQNGRVGVSWSGGGDGKTPGSGTAVVSNHVEVASGTTCYSVDGSKVAGGSDTNENRGYNQGGYASNVTGNTGAINRQKTPDGYTTVDGEGVLHQAANSCDGLRTVWDRNDLTQGSSGYMLYYKLSGPSYNVVTDNKVIKGQSIGCLAGNGGNCGKDNHCSGNDPKCTGF